MDIADQLQDFGFKVLEAANAAEAVAMLEVNADIKIMFTDVDMPGGMDGPMLAAAVRDKWPPIKIIVTSGHRKARWTTFQLRAGSSANHIEPTPLHLPCAI